MGLRDERYMRSVHCTNIFSHVDFLVRKRTHTATIYANKPLEYLKLAVGRAHRNISSTGPQRTVSCNVTWSVTAIT
jgi:hypothetical protein